MNDLKYWPKRNGGSRCKRAAPTKMRSSLCRDRAELTGRTLYDIAEAVNKHTMWFSQ